LHLSSAEPAESLEAERGSVALILTAFAVGLVTQRLGFWVGGFPLAASLAVVAGLLVMLAIRGELRVHWGRALAYYLVVAGVTASTLLNAGQASYPSYLLLLGLYAPLCLQTPLGSTAYRRYYAGVVMTAAAFAAGGVLQYLLQFVISNRELLFTWRNFLPEAFLIEYATLNKLSYTSSILKSNGLVFLEASAFSQFLARIILISLLVSVQRRWIPLLGIALLLTYSGTGMIVLAVFLPFALATRRAWRGMGAMRAATLFGLGLVGAGAVAAALLALGAFDLQTLLGRLNEVSAPGSSGYARYGATPLILREALEASGSGGLLFGLGPGQTDRFLTGYGFEVFATAWVKLLIEYGVLGLAAVTGFLTVSFWTATRSRVLTGAFLLQFLLLDGNLLVPQHVMLLLFLATLPVLRREPGAEWRTSASAAEPQPRADPALIAAR
jgi:hypothetical protein